MNNKDRLAEVRRAADLFRGPEKFANSFPTPAQIAANRENATHSTGPTTEAGKAAVSQNRTVHALNYNPATFRVLACENQAEYDQLLKALRDEQEPADTVEHLLVVSMAHHRWLLDRANRLQETCFDPQTGQITDPKLFSLYLRYATTHERAFHKCVNDLVKLRNITQKAEIGFESEKRKAERHERMMRFQEMEFILLQGKCLDAEADRRRKDILERREAAAQKAA